MKITRELDEPYITLGNRVFLKDVNYALNNQKKAEADINLPVKKLKNRL